MVCEACLSKKEELLFSVKYLQDETLKLFRFILQADFNDLLLPSLKHKMLCEFHDIFESFLVTHTSLIPSIPLREITHF
ncbi:hypothetical protein CO172_00485 [Candidatus Uhrbacteria bacterium CG_4_9_14_3_um_filter_36_7]|uniref:Uncharacterized protein n=1 Tax=Candidatus Uhrbacteria bacterium CG_4_9_14_3_um_filter_36_7 TaxID=1975033 RepID=A0A2M7XIC7_9BACT|nr:MAG: hypothetical protein CO172_00485 [Candidatus Uhrbacteria bacterium CG_4_9_14_3_um_filter_36_7]